MFRSSSIITSLCSRLALAKRLVSSRRTRSMWAAAEQFLQEQPDAGLASPPLPVKISIFCALVEG